MRPMVRALALGMALVTAACGEEPGGTSDGSTASPEASAAGPTEAAAAAPAEASEDEQEIRAFLDTLFAGYAADTPPPLFETPRAYFEPVLAAALEDLAEAVAETDGTADAFAADPVCDCQDFGKFSHRIDSVAITGNRAQAVAAISNFGSKASRRIELARTASGWRIHDLDGSFRKRVLEPAG